MANDFINIIQEIRGTGPINGDPGNLVVENGIYFNITKKDINGNEGYYGDIISKHSEMGSVYDSITNFNTEVFGVDGSATNLTTQLNLVDAKSAQVTADKETVEEAVSKLHELNCVNVDEFKTLEYVPETNTLKIPRAVRGFDGLDGLTPTVAIDYDENTGEVIFNTTYEDRTAEIVGEW